MDRPRVLIVFGVINLLFAVGWVVASLGALMYVAMPLSYFDNQPMPIDMDPVRAIYSALESPVYRGYWIANSLAGFIGAGLLTAGGVGLLMARPWGRRLSLAWAALAVIAVAASVGMTHGYLTPALASQTNEPLPSGTENAVMIVTSLVLRWAYPVVLMILLPRPGITALFEQAKQRRDVRAGVLASHDDAASPVPVSPTVTPTTNPQAATPAAPHATQPQATPAPVDPQSPPAAQRTWRDDPWNDPDAT
ncbi:hypothetical protein OT109_06925 [Phycisphaeraceae bacterium D3-23]